MTTSLCRRLLFLSMAAYFICLPLTAFCGHSTSSGCAVSGLVLTIGWLGLFTMHPANLIWLANPALLIAWGLIAVSLRAVTRSSSATRSLGIAAILTSGFALLVAACFLLPVTVMGTGHTGSGMYPDAIGSRGAGYWFWLVSMASAFASAIHLPVPGVPVRERTGTSG